MDQVRVSWSEFSLVPKLFNSHRVEERFTDVTLVSEDNQQFKAHKLVLSAGSKYFEQLLEDKNHPHLMLCMAGITSGDLKNVLDYIYNGEIMVPEEDLQKFLNVASNLKCLGLSISKPENDIQNQNVEAENIEQEQEYQEKSKGNESFKSMDDIISEYIMSTDRTSKPASKATCTVDGVVVSRKDLNEMLEPFCKKEANGTFSCTQCQAVRNKKANILEHAQTHINCEWKCENCWRVFKTSAVLRTHNNKSLCSRGLCPSTRKAIKDTPKESSFSMIPQFCKIEGEMFSLKDLNKMIEPLYQKSSENSYCCLKCPTLRHFTEKFNIEEHTQTHVNELEFTCTFCDEIFKTTSTLRKHNIKIHSSQLNVVKQALRRRIL